MSCLAFAVAANPQTDAVSRRPAAGLRCVEGNGEI